MTAIAGVWRFDGRPDAGAACNRILAAQHLYGPHDCSVWDHGNVALGRRLMRTLPEDEFDHQPLIGERYVLVADVRLDNRDDLITELHIPTPTAGKLSDAAILLAALERWGMSALGRLVGDFSFAVWDKLQRELKLARDPLGQRPLHYHRGRDFFAFSSMPKGLHALPEVPRAPDCERLAETLILLPETGRRSFFKDIERIEPAHEVTISANGFSTRRYWQPQRKTLRLRYDDEYVEAIRTLLDQAVRPRLRSTGVVAAELSGGLDSGAVTATAARLLASSGRSLPAFTAVPRNGYEGPAPANRIINEGPLAGATAALYPNIEHIIVPAVGCSPMANLDRSFYLCDRPMIRGAAGGTGLPEAVAKRGVKVMLTGDLGNMTLSYNGLELLSEDFGSGHWLRVAREWRALVSRGMRWRGPMGFILGPRISPELWVWLNRAIGRDVLELHKYSAINSGCLSALGATRTHDFSYRPWKDGFEMRAWSLQRVDQGNYRKGVLGGSQVDYRDPTADIRLVEFCLSVPTEQYLRNGVTRSLARRALADRLPEAVLNEWRRGLNGADWHENVDRARSDFALELDRIEGCSEAQSIIDVPRLRRLVAEWPSDWHSPDVVNSYRYMLPRAVKLGHFIRSATGSNQ